MNDKISLTPMLKQYLEIKKLHKDKILFFRMGDFYEMFFEDAKIASKILNIALTSRHKESNIPMCGIPFHALSNYTQKLLDNGYKIAICEQVEDPKKAKTIVKREVTKILTPAINSEIDNLNIHENYYLFVYYNSSLGIIDFSNGDFFIETDININLLINEIEKHSPKEILISRLDFEKLKKNIIIELYSFSVNYIDEKYFQISDEVDKWIKKAELNSDFPIDILKISLSYIYENNKFIPTHIRIPEKLYLSKYLELDENTLMHLEILKNSSNKSDGTLFSILNNALTPMGTRLLKKWLSYPLLNKETLQLRYNFIEELIEEPTLRKNLSEILINIGDIERLNSKIALKNILPTDLISLKNFILKIPKLQKTLSKLTSELSQIFLKNLKTLESVYTLIDNYILEEPSNNLNDGDYIKSGINDTLDELRELRLNARKWLLKYENEIKEKYSISNLKIKYNKVFGYFIEITKKTKHSIPDNFIRKQTLVNAERYITEELKDFEEKILSSDEKITEIQKKLYNELLEKLLKYCSDIKQVSDIIAIIDILNGFAALSIKRDYCKPEINDNSFIEIIEARHPVLEILMQEEFIPNDLIMNKENNIYIITGPNMAGKSTYMRQNALLIIMAQIGCFVPAQKFNFPIFNRIFTRIGAKDRLLEGESTFMVEMNETSKILKNLTEKSFIILDEIGRGTSTYDGMSIAWAILEFLALSKKKPFVLFATHYHELTKLEENFYNIKNFSVDVKELEDKLLFLRKIKPGPADRSYGIEVASLAKLPITIIKRAKEILYKLEKGSQPKPIKQKPILKSIFDSVKDKKIDSILTEINSIDINNTTPLEALNFLNSLKEKIKELP